MNKREKIIEYMTLAWKDLSEEKILALHNKWASIVDTGIIVDLKYDDNSVIDNLIEKPSDVINAMMEDDLNSNDRYMCYSHPSVGYHAGSFLHGFSNILDEVSLVAEDFEKLYDNDIDFCEEIFGISFLDSQWDDDDDKDGEDE